MSTSCVPRSESSMSLMAIHPMTGFLVVPGNASRIATPTKFVSTQRFATVSRTPFRRCRNTVALLRGLRAKPCLAKCPYHYLRTRGPRRSEQQHSTEQHHQSTHTIGSLESGHT